MAKILIVEDDPAISTLLFLLVKNLGHMPVISPNGSHAWDVINGDPGINLLLVDYMMPKLNGRDLIQMIRKSEKLGHLPIVMISAIVGLQEVADLLGNELTYFLPKPIEVSALKEVISRYIAPPEPLHPKPNFTN